MDRYKILGQSLSGELALDGSTLKETVVYEVPENTQASISAIQITNSSNSNKTYNIFILKNNEKTNTINVVYGENNIETILKSLDKQILVYNKNIKSGQTHEFKGGITLSSGDQIRVKSSSNEIITNIYGVEII